MNKPQVVTKFEFNGKTLKIPKRLKQDLDISWSDMFFDEMDSVIVIDGKEGTGKSQGGRLIGAYLAYKTNMELKEDKIQLNEKNVHFGLEEYIKSSENGVPFQINILDESRQVLNKKRSMSSINVKFTNWLSENRKEISFRMKKIVNLCSEGSCCPVVKISDKKVEIGEEGNMCVLKLGEWEALKRKVLEKEL